MGGVVSATAQRVEQVIDADPGCQVIGRPSSSVAGWRAISIGPLPVRTWPGRDSAGDPPPPPARAVGVPVADGSGRARRAGAEHDRDRHAVCGCDRQFAAGGVEQAELARAVPVEGLRLGLC